MSGFTHFDADGHAVMVDVSEKEVTARTATARGTVMMDPKTLGMIVAGEHKKGDVLGIARIAGITGAKRTSDLIPLCHPLGLSKVTVDLAPDDTMTKIEIEATAKVTGQTGVEMEALTAVSVAALTVYDMCKAVDKTMRISDIRLVFKDGGRSGRFEAS